MSAVELQPDELEALQAETGPAPAAKVSVEGPVRVQQLPRKAGGTFNKVIGTTPSRFLTSDHRRALATLMSVGQNMYVALSMASAADVSRMALWPANVPYVVSVDSEVWVASATATTTVSVITELWATGE